MPTFLAGGGAWDGHRRLAGPVRVLVRGGEIAAVDSPTRRDPRAGSGTDGMVDLGDAFLTPGFVDAHTHLLYAGDRSFEAKMRREGKTYLEILAAGGGIHHTVAATKAADDATLLGLARERLEAMRAAGTTTVEAKTGYGLEEAEELRHLALYRQLAREGPSRLVSTLLMAHAVPPGMERGACLAAITAAAAAAWRQGLATRFDLFLEAGAFTLEEADSLLGQAAAMGYDLTLHAGQFSNQGGAALATRRGARSLDHGEHLGAGDAAALAGAGVAVGLLPTCNEHLATGIQPDARALLDAGVRIFLATDHNAGSSPATSLLEVAALARRELGLAPDEILAALTSAPAAALAQGRLGRLAPGAHADLAAWEADPDDIGAGWPDGPSALFIGGEPVTQ